LKTNSFTKIEHENKLIFPVVFWQL